MIIKNLQFSVRAEDARTVRGGAPKAFTDISVSTSAKGRKATAFASASSTGISTGAATDTATLSSFYSYARGYASAYGASYTITADGINVDISTALGTSISTDF